MSPAPQPLRFHALCLPLEGRTFCKPAKTVWHLTDFLGQWESPTGTLLPFYRVEVAWQDSRAQHTRALEEECGSTLPSSHECPQAQVPCPGTYESQIPPSQVRPGLLR